MLYSENLGDFLLSITDKTGKIIQVNEKFCDVSKYSENEILGKTHKILKSGHHPDSFYKNLWMTISKGKPFSCLIKNKAKDGKTYWLKSIMIPILDENSNPSQYVCVSYKVIIQNEADKIRLKFTNNIADVLNESATVVITDKTGTITYVNKRFCELCKYPIEELLGRNTRILKSGYHSQEFYETLWSTISNGKIWRGDLKNKAADGTFYWVRTTIVPIFDENKNIKNYISIRTDITSQVKLSEKLVKAERLSSIGELASRMSHDIRNPLSIIAVSLENLKILYGINDLKQKQFDKIGRSIDRIVHQIDDVLDFVKIQPTEMSKIKISKVIADSLDSIYIPNNILLKLPKNDIELFCNEKQFSIALNNLILNGIQAIDGKGTVEITVEENDDSIIIQVKDSGKGIPEKDLDKIFEPLFTTKQQGTGLGLSSVKSIVESHGGIISVTSSPTVFTITLPKINDN